jgi:opine dehydrogenase
MSELSVTVLGGGHGAFAVAADLGARGFDVRMLEDVRYARSLDGVITAGGIHIDQPDPLGHAWSFAPVSCATYDPEAALTGSDIILFVVPAYAERRFSALVSPYVAPGSLVVFACGTFGGALEFVARAAKGSSGPPPVVAELEALIVGGRKGGAASVRFSGRKRGLRAAILPSAKTEWGLRRLRRVYDDLKAAPNVFQTGLGNLNLVLHPPVMILNAGRIAAAESPFEFYRQGVTPAIAQVMEHLDNERTRVGRALGVRLASALRRLREWYPSIQGANGLYEAVVLNPAYGGLEAPQTLDHRFLTEDVLYGLVPLEGIARELAVDVPMTRSLIELTSALMGRDVRAEGRTVSRLGLQGLTAETMLQRVSGRTERLSRRPSLTASTDEMRANPSVERVTR